MRMKISVLDKITSSDALDDRTSKVISTICLAITILLFWLPAYHVGRMVLFFDLSRIPLINELPFATVPLQLKPGLRAGLTGLLLVAPLYLRGVLHWKRTSVYSIVSFGLNLCLAATIAVVCFENVTESLLDAIWPIRDVRMILLVLALVLGWIGMRAIAGLAYILLFLLVAVNISVVNDGMAFNGFLCVLFGTVGLITQNGLGPAQLFRGIIEAFRGPGKEASKSVRASRRIAKRQFFKWRKP